MNFKAHMTLLSWRELLEWLSTRGAEAAVLLQETCKADTNHEITHNVFWDRTEPSKVGWLTVIVSSHDFYEREVEFVFEVKESDWFSHDPLTIEMFKPWN